MSRGIRDGHWRICAAALAMSLTANAAADAPCMVIAHAGGEYGGARYTNSYEAVESSRRRGVEIVEIDFAPTGDGQWHCLHDLSELVERDADANPMLARFLHVLDRLILQWPSKRMDHFPWVRWLLPSTESVEQALDREALELGRRRCSLRGLLDRVDRDGGPSIVSDTKYWNGRLLDALARTGSTRVIPQVYTVEEFRLAQSLGFKKIILSLYKRGSAVGLQLLFREPQLWAITVPVEWYTSPPRGEPAPTVSLEGFQGKIFVHPVESIDVVQSRWGIDGMYSSRLDPAFVSQARCGVRTPTGPAFGERSPDSRGSK